MNPILFALAGRLLLGTPSEPAAPKPAAPVTLRRESLLRASSPEWASA